MMLRYGLISLALCLSSPALAQMPAPTPDTSPHKSQAISVQGDVALEVLDWGGTGRPLILLPGLSSTAHVFDKFAPNLTDKYHVYGITRRGWGESGKPDPTPDNYSASRLGLDVVAVIDALKVERPILVGWSFGGEELSAVAARAPNKIGGLIYLDAAYSYAYYAPGSGVANLPIDANELRRDLETVTWGGVAEQRAAIARLKTSLPKLQRDLRAMDAFLEGFPKDDTPSRPLPTSREFRIFQVTMDNQERHGALTVPTLAIFALNQGLPANPTAEDVQRGAVIDANNAKTAAAFEKGNPNARVVRLANSRHNVFTSNEAEVLREMNQFISKLP